MWHSACVKQLCVSKIFVLRSLAELIEIRQTYCRTDLIKENSKFVLVLDNKLADGLGNVEFSWRVENNLLSANQG